MGVHTCGPKMDMGATYVKLKSKGGSGLGYAGYEVRPHRIAYNHGAMNQTVSKQTAQHGMM